MAAQSMVRFGAFVLLILLVLTDAKTPPGIAKNPSNATCKIKKYKHCYNLVHVCLKFCPDECRLECASCKPICGPETPYPPPTPTPYPPPTPTPSPPTPTPSPPTPTPSPLMY